jgi:hypothetical protein
MCLTQQDCRRPHKNMQRDVLRQSAGHLGSDGHERLQHTHNGLLSVKTAVQNARSIIQNCEGVATAGKRRDLVSCYLAGDALPVTRTWK